ncbi:MAG: DnaJ domain-containing protein, partial [Caulobacteraceae bacterium]|nr:DnaJ domain-containing protein [Caulobacteraceae bacterium]
LGAGPQDPYVILAVEADASDDAVRTAWRRALSEAHPDRAQSRGLPSEFVELAHLKSAAINEAYDTVMRERRAMVEA